MEAHERIGVLAAQLAPADAELLWLAFGVADAAHRGQLRRHGGPFIGHPVTAATILVDSFGVRDGEILAAMLLHDVVEDTALTIEDVRRLFPERTADIVARLTDPAPDMTSDERRDHYRAVIWPDPDATLVKSADRLSNLADVLLTGDRDFIRRFAARTRNELLSPGAAPGRHPIAAPLLLSAVAACERSLAAAPDTQLA
jgi:(p)ppGpp synthase/HD superfamily hydrolase